MIMLRFLFHSLLILFFSYVSTCAHEIRPAYLELKALNDTTYTVKWKVPINEDLTLHLIPIFPISCEKKNEPNTYKVGGAMISRWIIDCKENLYGQTIAIDGIKNTFTDVLVRIQQKNGTSQIERLTPVSATLQVKKEFSTIDIIRTYTGLGIKHILLGFDHLLFVFGLLLIVKGWWRLAGTITAFTFAHSITLATATLGYIHIAQAPVEAMIALSIMILAIEVIRGEQGEIGLSERYPWLVAFMFGLLHGIGFAGALTEIGLPEDTIPQALLFFNIGVEIGQLIFVLILLGVYYLIARQVKSINELKAGKIVAAYIIGGFAAYWFIERVYTLLFQS